MSDKKAHLKIAIRIAIAVSLLAFASTMAMFISTDEVVNKMTTGKLDIELTETL